MDIFIVLVLIIAVVICFVYVWHSVGEGQLALRKYEQEEQERQVRHNEWEDASARERERKNERAHKIAIINKALKLTEPSSAEEERILILLDKLDLCRDEWSCIDGVMCVRTKVKDRMTRAAYAEAELQMASA